MHELYYGAFRSKRQESNLGLVDGLLFEVVVPFDVEDSRQAGEIRADLALRGVPISPFDVLIAGQAKARSLTVVTGSVKEFSRVDGLAVEAWESDVA